LVIKKLWFWPIALVTAICAEKNGLHITTVSTL
jgi:hypothetical protein